MRRNSCYSVVADVYIIIIHIVDIFVQRCIMCFLHAVVVVSYSYSLPITTTPVFLICVFVVCLHV